MRYLSTPTVPPTPRPFNPMLSYQLIDPTTPTGGFAHSNTLEASSVFGLVPGMGQDKGMAVQHYAYLTVLQR